MRGSCKPPLLEDPDGMVLTVLYHFLSLISFCFLSGYDTIQRVDEDWCVHLVWVGVLSELQCPHHLSKYFFLYILFF